MTEENPYAPPEGKLKGPWEAIGGESLNYRVGRQFALSVTYALMGILLVLAGWFAEADFILILNGGGLLVSAACVLVAARKAQALLEKCGQWNRALVMLNFRYLMKRHLLILGAMLPVLGLWLWFR